jgi:site-specific DNA-methyltransferase (adenine-specific)
MEELPKLPSAAVDLILTDLPYPTTVIGAKSDKGLHPTQKPLALCAYLIRTYTEEGATVLDSCMGSGTTGVAAVGLGRRFIGIEKDPAYYQTAKSRIEKEQKK